MTRQKNLLCFGDNLVFLKNQSVFPDDCVDLLDLDPPFNSQRDHHEFQYWALGFVGARPWSDQKKKGADKGIDGVRFINDEGPAGRLKPILVHFETR